MRYQGDHQDGMLREGLGDMMGQGRDGVAQLVWNWDCNLGLDLCWSASVCSVRVTLSLLSDQHLALTSDASLGTSQLWGDVGMSSLNKALPPSPSVPLPSRIT